MIEHSLQKRRHDSPPIFAVIQVSPRRWAVAEQSSFLYPNEEFKIITKLFGNRIDAHQTCSEIANKPQHEYSDLTKEHLLDLASACGNTSPRSRLLASSDN